MDHDAYQHEVYEKCTTVNKSEDEIIYESQSTYNPYNIHMGQMTIYRLVIEDSILLTGVLSTCTIQYTNVTLTMIITSLGTS